MTIYQMAASNGGHLVSFVSETLHLLPDETFPSHVLATAHKPVAAAVGVPALSRYGGFFSRFHGRFTKSELLRPSHRRPPLLHSARNARAMHRASRFGAGWSSPVARQAHNLKVVGSNPTPATIKNVPPSSLLEAAVVF